jgi:hypothetical protein
MFVSLQNYNHIVLFAIFTLMTLAQFRKEGPQRFALTLSAVLLMGVVVEVEQALFGRGHCRVRDLIPDTVWDSSSEHRSKLAWAVVVWVSWIAPVSVCEVVREPFNRHEFSN